MAITKVKKQTTKNTKQNKKPQRLSLVRRLTARPLPTMIVAVFLFSIVGVVYLQLTSAQAVKRDRIKVIEHNQTEGNMLDVYWTADVLLFSETDHQKIRNQSPKRYNWYFPDNDSHQAIGWNTETMRLDTSVQQPKNSTLFHRSGQAEGWPNIATPARYIHEVHLVNRKTGVPITVYETWWLNSWRTEERRREIVKDTTFPKTKKRMAVAVEKNRVGIAGGDFNNISYDFSDTFPGWKTAPDSGLDRMFWTKDPRIEFHGVTKGPQTGVGSQMKHHSLISEFTIKSR